MEQDGMTGPVVSSAETIIHAAAANRRIPVGEDLQQRQHFSAGQGLDAKELTQLLPCSGPGDPCTGQGATGQGLAVQVKVVQAGAAVWLPAQQGCDWPVNVMLEVSVFSSEALPGGVDVSVIADAVSAMQRVTLAHGSPLPMRLQRALVSTAQRAAKASTTAFNAPDSRRVAHVAVPEAGVWAREHLVISALTFQRHSDLRPLSLMFAATAEAIDSSTSASNVATATLLPCTVSMRSLDEVSAALRVLRLPDDVFDRIHYHRSMDVIHARKPCAAPEDASAAGASNPPAVGRTKHGSVEHAQDRSRERSSELLQEDSELTISEEELPDATTGTRSTSPRSVRTGCDACRPPHGHTPTQVLALPVGSPDACSTDCACSHARTRLQASPDRLERERERDVRHLHKHVEAAAPLSLGAMVHQCMAPTPPLARWSGQRMVAAGLRLPTLDACEMALAELLSDLEGQ